jgi:hypothetical protein
MNQPTRVEPSSVSEPVTRALNLLILGTAASFALSVMAVLATVLAAEGHVHAVAHLSLPALMVAVIVVRLWHRLVRHRQPGNDAWNRARAIDSSDTLLAGILSVAVPLAWLAGGVAILMRHAPHFHGLAFGMGVWLPVGAALWILATFAWTDACRDGIALGLDRSDQRFREYWRNIGRGR